MCKSYSEKVREMACNLKKKLQKGLSLDENDYLEIMSEANEYEQELKTAESNMERSKYKFIEAQQTTIEVLKVAGEVEISTEMFSKKGDGKFQCLFVL